MENSFPRIYSLSTIGIKQHFNCNYRLHPTRTDFIGESGSGKSMIADMIQLILVGSGAYLSSTKSNQDRKPKGMVIEPKGRQSGIGYIFLNIEVRHNKFIVIGAYLESSHDKVQPFAIQSGYDWEHELMPLSKPFYYQDILLGDQLVPIEKLRDQLEEVRLKIFSRRKYHQLLFRNEIVSLDLTNDKTLNSYASILRSFSRGKGFKTDPNSLKNFLFGDEDQNKLLQKYQEEIKAIDHDFQEHQLYMKEIDVIKSKQEVIEDIVTLYKEYRDKQAEYLVNKNWYWKNNLDIWTSDLAKVDLQFKKIRIEQASIRKKIAELEIRKLKELKNYKAEFEKIDVDQSEFLQKIKIRELQNEELERQKSIIAKVENWLEDHDHNLDRVRDWHDEERQKIIDKEHLDRFIQHLEVSNQLKAFEESRWYSDFVLEKKEYETRLRKIENEIKKLNIFSTFSNINDPHSLAVWALHNLSFPISHEIESILVHFQGLPRVEPKNRKGMRYLPLPSELLTAIKFRNRDENGFWIDLDGVYEFIEYTNERYLDTPNPGQISNLLATFNSGVKEKLTKLNTRKAAAIELRATLFSFSDLEKAVNLYSNKENVLNYQFKNVANLTADEFKRNLALYEDRIQILERYSFINEEYRALRASQMNHKNNLERLKEKIQQIESYFDQGQLTEQNTSKLIKEKEKIKIDCNELILTITPGGIMNENIEEILFGGKPSLHNLYHLQAKKVSLFEKTKRDREDTENQVKRAEQKLVEAQEDYLIAFGEKYKFQKKNILSVNQDPEKSENSLRRQFEQLEMKFQQRYEMAIDQIEDKAQLVGYSLGILAHKLLPTVFITSKIDEDLVSQKISERLNKLMRDINEIGSRKVEILKRIFSEVYNTYRLYVEKIKEIDSYLKNKNHTITGGNRASLKYKRSSDYPDKWMGPFRKQLDDALYNFGLFESLKKEVDINKMMIKAFKAAGGGDKVTPEDLLNPKSYFDLEFNLKLDSGNSNAGSQGQTYTANALLGLARLSLINEGNRRGLKIMPIDEAEGLGGNYDMLHELAKRENYQIISMSIDTAGDIKQGGCYIYIMNETDPTDENTYVPPFGIFNDEKIIENIDEFIQQDLKKNE